MYVSHSRVIRHTAVRRVCMLGMVRCGSDLRGAPREAPPSDVRVCVRVCVRACQGFTSLKHTEADVDATLAAAKRVFARI